MRRSLMAAGLAVAMAGAAYQHEARACGTPADFAWVLPIKGTVSVGVSSDSLFAASPHRR